MDRQRILRLLDRADRLRSRAERIMRRAEEHDIENEDLEQAMADVQDGLDQMTSAAEEIRDILEGHSDNRIVAIAGPLIVPAVGLLEQTLDELDSTLTLAENVLDNEIDE